MDKKTHPSKGQGSVRNEQFARALVSSSLDMIIAVDEDGLIIEFNPSACERFKYPEEQILGQHSRALYATDEEYQRVQAILNDHGHFKGEVLNRTSEGETFAAIISASRIYDEQGGMIGTMGVSRDISGTRLAQQKLEALFESSEHMLWSVNRKIALTSFNKGYNDMIYRLYGVAPELSYDLMGARKKFASETYHQFWEGKYQQAFEGNIVQFETELTDKHGAPVFNEIFLSPVYDHHGAVSEVFGIGHEITEKKLAEKRLHEQQARMRAIVENSANMMIWTLDEAFKITSCNTRFREVIERAMGLKLDVGDAFLASMRDFVAGAGSKAIEAKYKAALRGKPQQFEVHMVNAKGRALWVETFLDPIHSENQVREISCLAYGITDKKEAEQELLHSLNEKEVLLKEVHHRVKNNLQIISSILNLQSSHVQDDPDMVALMRDSQDRIRSMAYIHESLYRTKNFNSIDLLDYIDRLAHNLLLSYSHEGKVRLITELDPVEVDLDQAIPCGLILNELISNALKHGFPDGSKGSIRVGLKSSGKTVLVTIQDDGTGFPDGFDMERSANLGLQLVQTLTEQLDGSIELIPGKGAGYLFTFERSK